MTVPSSIQIIPPGLTRWDGRTVMTDRDCALMERFTGRRYVYRVLNMTTGESAYICHKPKPASETDQVIMVERFLSSCTVPNNIAPSLEHCVDVKRGSIISNEKLAATLDHVFENLLPEYGYSLRPEQLKLARDIFGALSGRMVSLAEAGVGIGKTHAYLIAAAIIKRGRVNDFWLRSSYPDISHIAELPVVVATSSTALQKAIVEDYVPEISNIMMTYGVIAKPMTCVIRKGSIDLDAIDYLDAHTKRRINVAGHCKKSCDLRRSCRYHAFLKQAQSDKNDFQICNHNYLLADTLHRCKGKRPLIPHYQAIVIDEAHKFLGAARSMYGTELSNQNLLRIARIIRRFVFVQGQSIASLWHDTDKLASQVKRLFCILVGNIPDSYEDDEDERFKTRIDKKAERCLHNIREILTRLVQALTERQVVKKHERYYAHTLRELESIQEQINIFEKHGDLIYWLEKTEGYSSFTDSSETLLCAIPKNLGEMLHSDLWSKDVPVVLTSGTLSASGDFGHIKLSLGLDRLNPGRLMETSRPSPFNYQENVMIYISESVPFPDSRDMGYIEAVADEMERLIDAAHGHTVALFTSYRVMDLVYGLLKKRGLPFPLFTMRRGDLNTIERFRQSCNGVLLAAGSMWEGIDLPGDILSLLIIVKLPFAVPDPINEHERMQCGSEKKYKDTVLIPLMLVKLLQGFGRLIRTMTDTGVVAILDFRVRKGGSYRNIVLRTLPKCRVTSSISAVRRFILSKKEDDYLDTCTTSVSNKTV